MSACGQLRIYFLKHWLFRRVTCCLRSKNHRQELRIIKYFKKKMALEFNVKKQVDILRRLHRAHKARMKVFWAQKEKALER